MLKRIKKKIKTKIKKYENTIFVPIFEVIINFSSYILIAPNLAHIIFNLVCFIYSNVYKIK